MSEEKIKLTLHPGELRIGTTIRLETGEIYEVRACDDKTVPRGRELKAIPSDAENADMVITFGDEVRSYGELYKVISIDLVSWNT